MSLEYEMEADTPQDNPDIQNKIEDIPEEKEADSYDELAKGAEVAEPVKRGRGRPKGSRNRVKVPPPPPSESEEAEPPPPHPPPPPASRGRCPQRENPKTHTLDVVFDEGYGGAGPCSNKETASGSEDSNGCCGGSSPATWGTRAR